MSINSILFCHIIISWTCEHKYYIGALPYSRFRANRTVVNVILLAYSKYIIAVNAIYYPSTCKTLWHKSQYNQIKKNRTKQLKWKGPRWNINSLLSDVAAKLIKFNKTHVIIFCHSYFSTGKASVIDVLNNRWPPSK